MKQAAAVEFSNWYYKTPGDILSEVRAAYERGDQSWLKRQAVRFPRELLAAATVLGVDMSDEAKWWLEVNGRHQELRQRELAATALRRAEQVKRTQAQLARVRELKTAQVAWNALDPDVPLGDQVVIDGQPRRLHAGWSMANVDAEMVRLLLSVIVTLSAADG